MPLTCTSGDLALRGGRGGGEACAQACAVCGLGATAGGGESKQSKS